MFLIMLIFILSRIYNLLHLTEKTPFLARIVQCFTIVMIYVIQPIFYLNGDKNFRTRVLEQGIWKALKKELFQSNAEIQSVHWFFKYFEIKKHTLKNFFMILFLISLCKSLYIIIYNDNKSFCKLGGVRGQFCTIKSP